MNLHPNTIWLMDWGERLRPLTPSTICLCSALAKAVGEDGQDYPSSFAIQTAKDWEERIILGERPWWEAVKEGT